MDMPFIETFEEARHFLRGPASYAHQTSPWKAPITSWMRPEPGRGQPPDGHASANGGVAVSRPGD